jgi:hypothetical protein
MCSPREHQASLVTRRPRRRNQEGQRRETTRRFRPLLLPQQFAAPLLSFSPWPPLAFAVQGLRAGLVRFRGNVFKDMRNLLERIPARNSGDQ